MAKRKLKIELVNPYKGEKATQHGKKRTAVSQPRQQRTRLQTLTDIGLRQDVKTWVATCFRETSARRFKPDEFVIRGMPRQTGFCHFQTGYTLEELVKFWLWDTGVDTVDNDILQPYVNVPLKRTAVDL